MLTQHYAMLKRNLLYAGVMRGKRLVVPMGHEKAVAIALRTASGAFAGRNWTNGWRGEGRLGGGFSSRTAVDQRDAVRVTGGR